MSTVSSPGNQGWRRHFAPLVFAFFVFYLLFHTFSGERGLYALFKEKRKLELVTSELAQVSAERAALEHRVRLMNSNSLDTDLLDEQARNVLGVAGSDEVIYYPPVK